MGGLRWVGPMVLALHGGFGRGAVFGSIANRLQGAARVVALDQRGHGLADHGGPCTRVEFVADAAAVIDRLSSDPVVVFGHSLGGITAYRLIAQHPELVRALVIEDVGAVMRQPKVPHPVLDVRGWRLLFDYDEMMAVQQHGLGDWWSDWLGST